MLRLRSWGETEKIFEYTKYKKIIIVRKKDRQTNPNFEVEVLLRRNI